MPLRARSWSGMTYAYIAYPPRGTSASSCRALQPWPGFGPPLFLGQLVHLHAALSAGSGRSHNVLYELISQLLGFGPVEPARNVLAPPPRADTDACGPDEPLDNSVICEPSAESLWARKTSVGPRRAGNPRASGFTDEDLILELVRAHDCRHRLAQACSVTSVTGVLFSMGALPFIGAPMMPAICQGVS